MSTQQLPEEEPGSSDEWHEELEEGDATDSTTDPHDFPSDDG